MYWVIQDNVYNEPGYKSLLTALQRLGLPHSVHKVIPFVGEITDTEILDAQPAGTKFVVLGSYSLANHAVKRGWTPGAWLENLDFEIQRQHWGKHMLNADAQVYRFEDVPEQIMPFFLRPVEDTKSFTGGVFDYPYYLDWLAGVRKVNDPLGLLTVDTRVMLCTKKEIYSETRCWMVNRKVVTASLYRIGTHDKRYAEVRGSRWDNDLIAYAEDRAGEWSPNKAYVLDIAEVPHPTDKNKTVHKIIEVNNLNSAGWYAADLNKLIMSLEDLEAI